ncbi:Cyanovirin-N [Xylaria venustula]|nr:Cyanovirin-N [Xylaria venustula]
MRFLATIATIGALLGAANAAPSTNTNGTVHSFTDSCDNTYQVYQHDTTVHLSASCRSESGDWLYSELDLNHCIANSLGSMVARKDGNFGQTCNRMGLHGGGSHPLLYAYCSDGKYAQLAVIDMGNFVDNEDGRLICFGYYGE